MLNMAVTHSENPVLKRVTNDMLQVPLSFHNASKLFFAQNKFNPNYKCCNLDERLQNNTFLLPQKNV